VVVGVAVEAWMAFGSVFMKEAGFQFKFDINQTIKSFGWSHST
jgi:hypothetical protein